MKRSLFSKKLFTIILAFVVVISSLEKQRTLLYEARWPALIFTE